MDNSLILKRFNLVLDTLVSNKIVESKADFREKMDIAPSSFTEITKGRTKLTTHFLNSLFEQFHVSPNYIFLNQGPMFIKQYTTEAIDQSLMVKEDTVKYNSQRPPIAITVDELGNNNIVLVDVKAAAGYVTNYAQPSYLQNLTAFKLPGAEYRNATFRAFEVSGDSMFDTLYHGDIVICKSVDGFQDIRDGYIHVLVTYEEVLVKRVLNRTSKRGKLILQSDNENYPPREIDALDVREIWLVKGFLGFNMPNRRLEIKKVISDLQVTMLEVTSRLDKLERKK